MDTETLKKCEQCQEEKPLSAFWRTKNSKDGHMKNCSVCHKANLQKYREAQQAEQERQRQAREQRLQELREQGERAKVREQRYKLLRPRSRPEESNNATIQVACVSCGKLVDLFYQPSEGVLSQIYCPDCHEAQRTERRKEFDAWVAEQEANPRPMKERQAYCVVCGARKGHRSFPWGLDGHSFARSWGSEGITLYISCKDCLENLATLPLARQRQLIQLGCKRAFGDYQAVYKLTDPETKQIRYIGRTNNVKDRYSRHLKDISGTPHYHHVSSIAADGTYMYEIDRTRPPIYTRSNWIYDLRAKGLKPSISVLYEPLPAPLIIEWEQRYILHGLQQGWPLTNLESEHYNIQALQNPDIDFLHDPFEKLLKLAFFQEGRLEAFIRKWYDLTT